MATYELEAAASFNGTNEAAAQGLLEALTGKVVPRSEAKTVLERIPDHKWYLSERLGRDVGIRVAAVDLLENFHSPVPRKRFGILTQKVWNEMKDAFVKYMEAKGNAMPM